MRRSARASILARRHQPDSVLTICRRNGSDWRVVAFGTAGIGCDHPRLPNPRPPRPAPCP